jgi:hypothetical protein
MLSGSGFELLESVHCLPVFVVCVQSYKKDSPSSGLFRVKVYNEHGMAQRNGTGMFPREVMNRFPLLPLEEEGRLNDMPLRENFVERVFAYYRWTNMLDEEPTPGGLVKFHTAHKLTLMAHSPKHYTGMGRLVADAGKRDWDELTAEYGAMLMEGLGVMGCKRSGRGQACQCTPALDGLPQESPVERGQTGAPGPHRGLPPGACAPNRAIDPAQAPPEPLPGSRLGAPAGVSASLSQGADAAQPRVGERRSWFWSSLA